LWNGRDPFLKERLFGLTGPEGNHGPRRDWRSPEYEIMDTGVFDDDRYWVTEVTYAKSADAAELLMVISVTNAGDLIDSME
jgi:hypothetical protein